MNELQPQPRTFGLSMLLPLRRRSRRRADAQAQAALATCHTAFEAAHLVYASAVARQETTARRLDRRGDLAFLGVLVTFPITLIVTIVAITNGASFWWALAPAWNLIVPVTYGSLCWIRSEAVVDLQPGLIDAVAACGGVGRFPATIWSQSNAHLLGTYPFFEELRGAHLRQLLLSANELEVYQQLLADGYEGTLDELVTVSRQLS